VDETIVALPVPLRPVSQVRASILLVSLQALSRMKLIDEYRRRLPESEHAAMFSLAGVRWVPIELARTHYRTCDALPIATPDRLAIGAYNAERLQKGWLNIVVRLSRDAGVTVWTILRKGGELGAQAWDGGGFEIRKRGPKDAHVAWYQQPLFESEQFTLGFAGMVHALVGLYATKVYVRPELETRTERSCGFSVSWV
jgi:hypothetical protein